MKNFSLYLKPAVAVGVLLLTFGALSALAATDGTKAVNTVTTNVKSALSAGYNLAFLLAGGVCMVNLIKAIAKYQKDDNDPSHSIVRWLIGFIASVLFLTVLKTIFF